MRYLVTHKVRELRVRTIEIVFDRFMDALIYVMSEATNPLTYDVTVCPIWDAQQHVKATERKRAA